MKRLKCLIRWLAWEGLRTTERILPIPCLALLLLPIAAVLALWEWGKLKNSSALLQHHSRRIFKLLQAPDALPFRWYRQFIGRVALYLSRFIRYWPDRLNQPCWSVRGRFHHKQRLEEALSTGRPIILATLHFGNLTELYHRLRAEEHPIAFLVYRDEQDYSYRDYLDELADEANGLQGVCRRFYREELWEAREFLKSGNRLLAVAMEELEDRAIVAQGELFSIPFATGALRMAMISNAIVIPCITRATGVFRSETYFGESIPDEYVTSRKLHPLALEHVMRELSPWIIENPEQCAPQLLAVMNPCLREAL